MGRSKNRKKRRLGRIHKQAVFLDPMIPHYVFEDSRRTRFETWCGFYKWLDAAEIKAIESYDAQDDNELEMKMVEDGNGFGHIEFPNSTEVGRLRRMCRHLKAYLEFDDSEIKSKLYHSKKTTRFRSKVVADFIKQFRGLVEKLYKKAMETEPEKIDDWVKELVENEETA